jgi:amidase
MRPYLKEVGADPGRLRIAFTTSAPTGVPVGSDCVRAATEAAALCVELGHDVVEASPAFDAKSASRAYFTVFLVGVASEIDDLAHITGRTPSPDEFEPHLWAIYQKAGQNRGSDYVLAIQTLHRVARQVARFFVDYDLWITPTLAEPPVPIGTFESPPDEPMQGMRRVAKFMPFTQICNITGQPAMSVPLFWNAQGLPVGTQFVGRFGDEATLFRVAAQLESARPWANRRPLISA